MRLCIGCFTAYPIALGLFPVLVAYGSAVSPWIWLASGLALGSVEFVSVAGSAKSRRAKVAVKVFLGAGLAATVYALLTLPVPVGWRVAAFVVGTVVAGLALLPRGLRMIATCRACVWGGDWEHCPGFERGASSKPS